MKKTLPLTLAFLTVTACANSAFAISVDDKSMGSPGNAANFFRSGREKHRYIFKKQ